MPLATKESASVVLLFETGEARSELLVSIALPVLAVLEGLVRCVCNGNSDKSLFSFKVSIVGHEGRKSLSVVLVDPTGCVRA